MRIGIVGAGNIGHAVAELAAEAGHDVVLSAKRGPEALAALEDDGIRAGTVEEAAEHGEVVFLAVPFKAVGELPADAFEGKVVVDATNYYPGRDGHVAELDDDATTSSELVAKHLDGATVVKAFNTMEAAALAEDGEPAGSHERLVLLLAGDDRQAKRVVAELIDELGFDAVDTGDLADGGRVQQPGSSLYGALLSSAEAREALGA